MAPKHCRKMMTAVGLLAAIGLVAASCGSDEASDPSGSVAVSTEASDSGDGASITTDSSDATDDGDASGAGTFRYAYYQSVTTFDPHLEPSAFSNIPLFVTYDRLVHLSPDGEFVPGLATDWEFSEDGTTLSLTLRDNVVFHDGAPLDAEAVKSNLDRALTIEGSKVASTLAGVSQVDVVDDSHVDLLLESPNVSLLGALSDRAGAMVCPSMMDDPNLAVEPCGAGMYSIAEAYQPGTSVAFERFADYWDPDAVGAARFEISILTDSAARLNALRTGEVDAAYLDPDQIDAAKDAGLNVDSGADLSFASLFINTEAVPALGDVRVRKAMAYAIDREGIVEGVLFGQGEPASQTFPTGYWAHNDKIEGWTYDPDKARALLKEAGFEDGFDVDIVTISNPLRIRVVEAIVAQWAEVGIRATPRAEDAVVVIDGFTTTKEIPIMFSNWSGRNDPSQNFAAIFLPGSIYNPGAYSSEKLVELYNESLVEQDPKVRASVVQDLSAETTENPGNDIVIYRSYSTTAATDQVTGLQHWVTGKIEFRGVGLTN